MPNCYENIIGLASEGNNCLPTLTDPQKTSNSGLYIADLEPIDSLIGINELSEETDYVWSLMEKARASATNFFIAETNGLLAKSVKLRQAAYSGKIGEPSAKELVTNEPATYSWEGVHILCASMYGATFQLRSVDLVFENDNSRVLRVSDKYNNVLFEQTDIALTGGRATVQINLNLPCYDQNGYAEYWVYYDNDETNTPYANRINCGCTGFTPAFDKSAPHFGKGYTKGNGWANWLMVEGVKFSQDDSFDDFDSWNLNDFPQERTQNVMNGLVLDVSVGCSIESIMCEQVAGFYINPFAMSIAKAIQLKSAELFTTAILSSAKISRATMINSEEMSTARQEWRMEYLDILNYITQNVQIADQSDCFSCRPMIEMNVKPILS
jgi:hypothetical protein